LTHMAQWIRGSLRFRYGKLCYSKQPVENWEYWYQPHEIEARYMEQELYEKYVGYDKIEQQDYFPNRLMSS